MVLGSSLSSLEHGKILKKGVQSEKSTSAEAGGPRRFDPWVRGVWLVNRRVTHPLPRGGRGGDEGGGGGGGGGVGEWGRDLLASTTVVEAASR